MKDRSSGFFFKIKRHPNQTVKQTCILKQRYKTLQEKSFRQLRVFVCDPIPKNANDESVERFIKLLPTLSVIFID